MLTAIVTTSATGVTVAFVDGALVAAEAEEGAGPENDLNPIFPELKEVAWGFGSFVVLALVLRLFLFRKVRDGMTSRYDGIQQDFAQAEQLTESARADVASYDAEVAVVRAEAQGKIEAARNTLEAERSAKLTDVNARIAELRAASVAELDAARDAARTQVQSAVADVAARAGLLATGKAPTDDAVNAAVAEAMGVSA